MSRRAIVGIVVGVVSVLSTACAAGSAGNSRSGDAIALSPVRAGNAWVLSGEQLWSRSSDLLSLIANRVSAVQVRRTADCPNLLMRGQKTYIGSVDPDIYVNGTRAGNTCLLEMMRSEDVERLEIYPMGVTNQPGIATNPNGVILIYLRSGETGPETEASADTA